MLGLFFLYSCAGEEDCSVSGCDDGFHCTTEETCEEDCIDTHCEITGLSCNHDTGLCEKKSCTETGCEENYICDSETQTCKPDTSCKVLGCNNNFICNDVTIKCEAACIQNACNDHFLCDDSLGTCYPACTTTGCQTDYICNASSGLCEHIDCTYNSCSSNLICNVHNGFCEAATEYPAGAIANRTWTDHTGKVISFKLLYNKYIKTGYPKAILLGHSAGWCPFCRRETPHIQAKYDASKTGNYYKLAVVQELCQGNTEGQVATPSFISSWVNDYSLTYPVVIGTQLHAFRSGVHPFMIIVDPKTMKVVIIGTPTWEYTEAEADQFMNLHIDPLYGRN